jgi:FeS assembly SUF system protein
MSEQLSKYDLVIDALKTVYDPEIPVNIYDLGLVYKIDINEKGVNVVMTLTAPGCPVAGDIIFQAEEKIKSMAQVEDVHVHLTFDPPWDKSMMSEEAKLELGYL